MTASAGDSILGDLAVLLGYPGDGYRDAVRYSIDGLRKWRSSLAELLAPFSVFVAEHSIEELEENYTRTFDIQPDCTLEVGWQLYGENYSRGKFLVRMRGLMRELGIEESAELPDHLTHILSVLGRLEKTAARELAATYVLPALAKMRRGLPSGHADKPHGCVLEAIESVLREMYSLPKGDSSYIDLTVLPAGMDDSGSPYDVMT